MASCIVKSRGSKDNEDSINGEGPIVGKEGNGVGGMRTIQNGDKRDVLGSGTDLYFPASSSHCDWIRGNSKRKYEATFRRYALVLDRRGVSSRQVGRSVFPPLVEQFYVVGM